MNIETPLFGILVCSRKFGPYQIPSWMQAQSLKTYCATRGMNFERHVVENRFPESNEFWWSFVNRPGILTGMVITSIWLLPSRAKDLEVALKAVELSGRQIHFAIESLIFPGTASIDDILTLRMLCQTVLAAESEPDHRNVWNDWRSLHRLDNSKI